MRSNLADGVDVVAAEDKSVSQHEAEVLSQVQASLSGSAWFALRTVKASYHEGMVILHGTLGLFYLSQMAQEIVRRVPGVLKVENQIEVR